MAKSVRFRFPVAHASVYRNADTNSDRYPHADSASYRSPNRYCDPKRNRNTCRDNYTYADRHSNTDGNTDLHRHAKSNPRDYAKRNALADR